MQSGGGGWTQVPGRGARARAKVPPGGGTGEELKLEEEEQEQQEGEEGLQGPGGRLATGPFLELEDREAGAAWGKLSSLAPSCPGPAWR